MKRPVDKEEYWKVRIEEGDKRLTPHISVYDVDGVEWRRIARVHRGICETHISPTSSVLDAGCGYGRASTWFEDYTGIDFSPDFIEKARGNNPEKRFSVANLSKLAYADKQFDWGICISIKGMIIRELGYEKWQEMENDLRRVCSNVLILEYTKPEEYEIIVCPTTK